MKIWQTVLLGLGVICATLFIFVMTWFSSTGKISKSQQEIRQEKIEQAQAKQTSKSQSSMESESSIDVESSVAQSTTETDSTYHQTYDSNNEIVQSEASQSYICVGDPIDYTDAPGPQGPEWYFECSAKQHDVQYIERVQTDKTTSDRTVLCGSFICNTCKFYQDFENFGYLSAEYKAYTSSLMESANQSSSN